MLGIKKIFFAIINSQFGQFFFNGAIIRLPEEMFIEQDSSILSIGQYQSNLIHILKKRILLSNIPDTINVEKGLLHKKGEKKQFHNIKDLYSLMRKNKYDLILCGHYTNILNDAELETFLMIMYESIRNEGLIIIWNFSGNKNILIKKIIGFPFSSENFIDDPNIRIFNAAKKVNVEFITEVSVRPFLFPFVKRKTILLGKPPSGLNKA